MTRAERGTRRAITTLAMTAVLMMVGGPALAHYCTNASMRTGAGVQVVFDGSFENMLWASKGLQQRVANGVVDPDTGEGFHGLIGIDFEADGVIDVTIYSGVGPTGAVPDQAIENGPACRGITAIWVLLEDCFEE